MGQTKDKALFDEWRGILDRHARVQCALTQALEHQHGLGMSEFEVLERLADEGRERYEAARPTHREVLERELS